MLEEKLSNLENENHILRQKAFSLSPMNNSHVKSFSEKNSGALALPNINQKPVFETPTPTKYLVPLTQSLTGSRRTRIPVERHETLKSPSKLIGAEDTLTHVDARYPAILFKQQLTACVEKIFGQIRDNMKKETSPLLSLCIQITQVYGFYDECLRKFEEDHCLLFKRTFIDSAEDLERYLEGSLSTSRSKFS